MKNPECKRWSFFRREGKETVVRKHRKREPSIKRTVAKREERMEGRQGDKRTVRSWKKK